MDEWVTQQIRDTTPFEEKPKHLICDNDKRYGPIFERVAQASGIEVIHTPYEAPRANSICERFVGRLRRECLDHTLVTDELQLLRVLKGYAAYFNTVRPHQGIVQRIPSPRAPQAGAPKTSRGIAGPLLNRLHHDYRSAAT
jgi:integrase-like protein